MEQAHVTSTRHDRAEAPWAVPPVHGFPRVINQVISSDNQTFPSVESAVGRSQVRSYRSPAGCVVTARQRYHGSTWRLPMEARVGHDRPLPNGKSVSAIARTISGVALWECAKQSPTQANQVGYEPPRVSAQGSLVPVQASPPSPEPTRDICN